MKKVLEVIQMILKQMYYSPKLLAKFNKYNCKINKSKFEAMCKICAKLTITATYISH